MPQQQSILRIYESLFEYNTDACFAIDTEGRFTMVNQSASDMTGYAKREMLGMSFFQLIQPERTELAVKQFARTLQGRRDALDFPIVRKSGETVDLIVTVVPIMEEGVLLGIICIAKDVTERNRMLLELTNSRNQLQNIFNSLDIFVWSIDPKLGKYLYTSEACREIYGVSPEEYAADTDTWKNAIHPDDLPMVEQRLAPIWDGQIVRTEYRIIHRSGEVKWVSDNAIPIYGETGEIVRFEGVIIDITQRKMMEEQLHHMAFHDALTGLPNRRMFTEELHGALAACNENGGKAAVLYLDLDRFKYINDSLGHDIGDQLLQVIAERLKGCLGESGVISRQGGDEFAILLHPVDGTGAIAEVAERVLQTIHQPVKLFQLEFRITTSIGISVYPDHATDIPTLLKQADQAMYLAKEKGKNNFQFFSMSLDETLARKMFIEQSLHQALRQDELLVYYQPIMNGDGSLTGFEALMRWKHPTLGFVSPAEMIPIAEDTGMIVPIGEWALLTACRQTKRWRDQADPGIGISVNLSAVQLKESLVGTVARILAETGLTPAALTLEITESTAMQNVAEIIPIIDAIRQLGVKLSIDDFGTGYSSLSYLKKFQIHTLKIDQSFVRDIEKDANQEAIIRAIVAMAESLRMDVVAEGVETEEQARFLRDIGCRRMQGYLFGKPMSAEETENRFFNPQA